MGRRLNGSVGVTVNRTPVEVFEYLRDVHRHNEWSPKPYRAEGIEGPVEAGSTFSSVGWVPGDSEHHNDVEVTAFQPPDRIEFTATEQGEKFISTYVLTSQGDGTKLEKILDMPRPDGVQGIFFPLLFGGFIKPATSKGLKMLKEQLEGGA
ncbi:MAG: SRPBCC family protein [Acidimicrobiia bacterium]|nr:SRPBCC family protein [Acidimicrobiia bacterium]